MPSTKMQPISPVGMKDRRRRVLKKKFACSDGGLGPSPKRVKFEHVGNFSGDKVKTSEAYINILRSELDKPVMWWSRAERETILEECHDEIDVFRRNNENLAQHFTQVFEFCQKPPSEESSNYLDNAKISLPSSIRGLEWGFAPRTISHRRAHIQEVLAIQDQVQTLPPEMRDRVLSSRSLRSSRPGRVLARILAEGDARNCKGLYYPEIACASCRANHVLGATVQ